MDKLDYNLIERDKWCINNLQKDPLGLNIDLSSDTTGAIFLFIGLTYQQARYLVNRGWLKLNERYNDSPRAVDFIQFIKNNKAFRAQGYIVPKSRPDTRITLDGIHAVEEISSTIYREYVKLFRKADEFDVNYPYRAWFD